MVARIVCGKSIQKALYYNEDKVRHKEAVLLSSGGFLKDPGTLSFARKLDRFTDLTRLNERTKTNAVHISLNFSRQDDLSTEKLKAIGAEYLERIGWGEQPFLMYQHFDAAHPHVHLVTTNINRHGERMETHNIGRNQSERARKALEECYGLVRAEDQKNEPYNRLLPIDIERVIYGRQPTKAAISRVVREVVSTYKFASLQEYNAILSQFGVYADRGKEGSLMFSKGGIQYRLVDKDGQTMGIPIKASSIFSNPTLASLEKLFPVNKTERKPYAERVKHQLDKALASARSQQQFEEQLQKQGIRVLLRHGAMGQVYGATFIDNATRTIFNGSDLGKQYAAKAFIERLAAIGIALPGHPPEKTDKPKESPSEPLQSTGKEPVHPAAGMPVMESLWDTLTSDEHEENSQGTLRKKKKIQGLE